MGEILRLRGPLVCVVGARPNYMKMAPLVQSAPNLEAKNIQQLPALPLGSRIKLDPWDDHVEMQKSKPVSLLSVRDKMSFEVAPVFPNLVRVSAGTSEIVQKQDVQKQDVQKQEK